jgi:DNA-binding NarL/FixJ family response regulator
MEFDRSHPAQSCAPDDGAVACMALLNCPKHALEPSPTKLRLRTYIVEDSPLIRENLIATLEELSPVSVVGTADDEHSAVAWLLRAGHGVGLVIVDLFLKGGSGLGVLREAQHMPSLACKIAVLSNYATPDMRRKCLGLGADRVFDKSHDIEELLRYCTQLADRGAGGSSSPG